MHIFEVHSNESACRKKVRLGLEQVNYLHTMGGVRKEGWLGNVCMKISFRRLKNLTSGIFGWMLEHSLHCAVIVAEYDINDKEAII